LGPAVGGFDKKKAVAPDRFSPKPKSILLPAYQNLRSPVVYGWCSAMESRQFLVTPPGPM
jgi:hypothetical protein